MGILGTVAGAYFGGPMGASLGGSLGSSLGGSAGGGGGSGITRMGSTQSYFSAKGGMVPRMEEGGVVENASEQYDTGGMIDAFADGGEVDEEGNIYPPEMDEEMMEGGTGMPEEEMAEGEGGNMVPPEASPSGGEAVDDVHAMVSEGEFVMPKDVTSWFGEKFMQNLINKARKEMSEPKAEGEPGPPLQAMALSPPSFQSEGASGGA
jgi:hypothetical protein